MSRRPELLAALGLCLVAAVWLLRAPELAQYPTVFGPDPGARLAMVQSFLSGGSLVRVAEPADLHPLGFYLAVLPSGSFHLYPPLFPLLSAGPYRLAGFPGLLLLPLVSALVACGFTAAAGRRLGIPFWPAPDP